jgi:hypothetical protein
MRPIPLLPSIAPLGQMHCLCMVTLTTPTKPLLLSLLLHHQLGNPQSRLAGRGRQWELATVCTCLKHSSHSLRWRLATPEAIMPILAFNNFLGRFWFHLCITTSGATSSSAPTSLLVSLGSSRSHFLPSYNICVASTPTFAKCFSMALGRWWWCSCRW